MANRLPLTDKQGEVRDLNRSDFQQGVPFSELSEPLRKTLAGLRGRGPQKEPTKERITIRLSPDVVSTFRDTGPGWQARIDVALKDWLKTHKRPSMAGRQRK